MFRPLVRSTGKKPPRSPITDQATVANLPLSPPLPKSLLPTPKPLFLWTEVPTR